MSKPNAQTLANVKKWAIGIGVFSYIAAASLAVIYGSAALYQVIHKESPHDLTLRTSLDNLARTADDPKEHKKVLITIAFPAGLLFLIAPMLMLGLGGSRRELFGSARFATRMEIQKAGLFQDKGIILGKFQGKFLMLGGSQSVMLSAPTRSGKGISAVVPNALSWPDSLIVLDVKPEIARITSGFRAKHGQKVFVWAPFAEDGRTHCYNPLAYIRSEYRYVVGDALAIAQIIYPTPTNASGSSVFFAETARNLFLGLTLYLVETPELPRTIGELLRQASGNGNPVKAYLQALIDERAKSDRPLSDKCVNALTRFLSTSDDVLTSILATVNAPLIVFEDALVDAATSKNDFLLTDLRRKRMTVYVCIPIRRLSDASVLLNMFYAQLLNLNTDQLPEHNPELKYQVLMINDEFTTMGRVNAFSKGIGYIAGFGLRCLTIVQSRAQLDSTYGKDDSRNFVTNHAAELMFAPRDQRDANEYSEALGHFTEKSESKGRSSSGKSGSSQSSNTSSAKRPLLYPQEFKEIGQDKEVLMVENVKPIMADKICYYTDPIFKGRLLPPSPVPMIDLEHHRARVERRVRSSTPGEVFTIEQVAEDFRSLPTLSADSTQDQLEAFVSQSLALMQVKALAANQSQAAEPADATTAAVAQSGSAPTGPSQAEAPPPQASTARDGAKNTLSEEQA